MCYNSEERIVSLYSKSTEILTLHRPAFSDRIGTKDKGIFVMMQELP
jgi:hypothetical protein